MEQMHGLDAKFLYSETPTAHMHTLKVAVFDMSTVGVDVPYDRMVELIGHRLSRLPPLRRRTVPVPWSLGHPVWVEDPDFDLRNHVARRRLAEPGGDRELAELVAEVASTPLQRDRPLWELVLVEGMEGGRLAVIAKIHHAVSDGAATVDLLERALAIGSGGAGAAWHSEPLPDRSTLVRLAVRAHRERIRRLPTIATRSVAGMREAASRRRASPVKPPIPFATSRTPFNVSLSSARTFAMTTVPLEDLKAVRRTFDVTLNDVYLAMCAGALRRYLADQGALPDRPLIASVPVGIDRHTPRRGGNHVDNLYVEIGTDEPDAAVRLRRIRDMTDGAKRVRAALGNDLLEERADFVPPQLYRLTIRSWTATHLANHVRPPVNVILSNVPGPRETLTYGGAELEALYSVGPVLEGIGVNMTAWSYGDRLHVSVLGCPESLPDPWALADALTPSLEELSGGAKVTRTEVTV